MGLTERVKVVPGVRSGQPIIAGTRITVWDILGWLAAGASREEIVDDYDELTIDDIQAALKYVYDLHKGEPSEATA